MNEKFSTKTADILFVVKSALWDIREGKIISAYELLSEMYDSVSKQIEEAKEEEEVIEHKYDEYPGNDLLGCSCEPEEVNEIKLCANCKYEEYNIYREPCFLCYHSISREFWEPKEAQNESNDTLS